jgi:acyl-CoA thioester hydrolase
LNEFIFPARVYYEDTDAGGVVYHANYLRFMERARTEWLRALGFEQDQLVQTLGIIFVVGHIDISYRKPARFNDELFINTSIHKLGKASIEFHQNITRTAKDQQRELLTTASVKVICVNMATFRSASIPTVIRELLQ